jgi:hypothetical protein
VGEAEAAKGAGCSCLANSTCSAAGGLALGSLGLTLLGPSSASEESLGGGKGGGSAEGVGGVKGLGEVLAGCRGSGRVGVEAPASTVLTLRPATAAVRAAFALAIAAAVLRQAAGSVDGESCWEGLGVRQAGGWMDSAAAALAGEGVEARGAASGVAAGLEKSHPLREEGGVGALGLPAWGSPSAPAPAAAPRLLRAARADTRAACRARRDCTLLRAFSLSRVAAA